MAYMVIGSSRHRDIAVNDALQMAEQTEVRMTLMVFTKRSELVNISP